MAFKEAYIIKVPDANPKENISFLNTEKYECYTVLVKNQKEAIEESCRLIERKIQSLVLGANFSNEEVGEIQAAVGKSIAVQVARGDGRSTDVVSNVLKKEWWS